MSPTRYRFSTPQWRILQSWGTRIRTWTNGVKVRCPTIRRFPNVLAISNCWGRDSNPQAIRHTHLKRTCIPVPSPQHEICCECNIAIFYEKSILNKSFWLCLFFLIQLIKINQIFIHIAYYEYSNYLLMYLSSDNISFSMWNQGF